MANPTQIPFSKTIEDICGSSELITKQSILLGTVSSWHQNNASFQICLLGKEKDHDTSILEEMDPALELALLAKEGIQLEILFNGPP